MNDDAPQTKPWRIRSKPLGWTVALSFLMAFVALVAIATFGVVLVLDLRMDSPVDVALAMVLHVCLLLPVWMLLGLFLLAPLFRLTGVLRYYSPYLIVSGPRRGRIDLHGATPFDYLILFRWRDRGPPAVRRILLWYLDGLLALARDMESGRLPVDAKVFATSYFFSASTARRYGFTVDECSRFAWGGFITYPTQFLTFSFARGRWALPPVHLAKRATIDGADLCASIARLERVRKRLEQTQDSPGGPRSKIAIQKTQNSPLI